MRVDSRRHFELRDELGVFGVAHIDDRGSVGGVHVAHIGISVLHGHQAAAWKIHSSYLFDLVARAELDFPFGCHLILPWWYSPPNEGCRRRRLSRLMQYSCG